MKFGNPEIRTLELNGLSNLLWPNRHDQEKAQFFCIFNIHKFYTYKILVQLPSAGILGDKTMDDILKYIPNEGKQNYSKNHLLERMEILFSTNIYNLIKVGCLIH